MSRFTVVIKTENDAFERPHGEAEIARILRQVAEHVENGVLRGKVQDINGNAACRFEAMDDSDEAAASFFGDHL